MANVGKTLVRMGNVKLFCVLGDSDVTTLRSASKKAGVHYAHARRMMKGWIGEGLLVKQGTLHGKKWLYTEKGLPLLFAAKMMLGECEAFDG